MKRSPWILLFILALLVHLVGIQVEQIFLQQVTKPLLVPLLLAHFLFQTKGVVSDQPKNLPGGKAAIVASLVFSWIGDILLLYVPKGEIYFLLGLSSFLLAHIFYILFFQLVRVKEEITIKLWLLLAVVIYYTLLIMVLFPGLQKMKLPVMVYGIVISSMLFLAMHMLFIKNKIAGRWMMTGALLFVFSDSILAVNKFYQPFEIAGVLIMLTYGMAQLFIVEGAARYIKSGGKG